MTILFTIVSIILTLSVVLNKTESDHTQQLHIKKQTYGKESFLNRVSAVCSFLFIALGFLILLF